MLATPEGAPFRDFTLSLGLLRTLGQRNLPGVSKPKPASKPHLFCGPAPRARGGVSDRATTVSPARFELCEDGAIAVERGNEDRAPALTYRDKARGLWLYQGNCIELLDAIAARYPEGRFDCIFADPPYFLSNGGITCHAGKMVKADKGDWDKSQGADDNHNFNRQWLSRCQRVLKPNGTIWVSGTHPVIFSIGFALQQLGFKTLNDVAWEKPNPPPNLSCRYFTHSTESLLWAAKDEQSRHPFNYLEMRKVTGKQMKTVWRRAEFPRDEADLDSVWTIRAPPAATKRPLANTRRRSRLRSSSVACLPRPARAISSSTRSWAAARRLSPASGLSAAASVSNRTTQTPARPSSESKPKRKELSARNWRRPSRCERPPPHRSFRWNWPANSDSV
jgi:site-specific DNA-methyltransferase (adenine-specific)